MSKQQEIPDPEVDFEGCIEAISAKVALEIRQLFPSDLDATETARRRVAMSGGRYISLVQMGAPTCLLTREREMLAERARAFVKALDEEAPMPERFTAADDERGERDE